MCGHSRQAIAVYALRCCNPSGWLTVRVEPRDLDARRQWRPCSHLIRSQLGRCEKTLAAMASGAWIVGAKCTAACPCPAFLQRMPASPSLPNACSTKFVGPPHHNVRAVSPTCTRRHRSCVRKMMLSCISCKRLVLVCAASQLCVTPHVTCGDGTQLILAA